MGESFNPFSIHFEWKSVGKYFDFLADTVLWRMSLKQPSVVCLLFSAILKQTRIQKHTSRRVVCKRCYAL